MRIELYRQQQGAEIIKVGHARIPLKPLLSSYPFPKLKGNAQIFAANVPLNDKVFNKI